MPAIAEASGNNAARREKFPAKIVQFSGGHANLNIRGYVIQTFGGNPAGLAHLFKIFGIVVNDDAVFSLVTHCIPRFVNIIFSFY